MTPVGDQTTSPIKIVGMMDNQIVIRLQNKRRLLYCENQELLDDISELIPVAGNATFVENTLVSFTHDNNTDKDKDEQP